MSCGLDALAALEPQAHVVTPVLVRVFALHRAANRGLDRAGDGIDRHARYRGQFAVGIDAHLGHAGAEIGVDVAEIAGLFHRVDDLLRFFLQHAVVGAAQVQLDGETAPGDEVVRGEVLRHGADVGDRVEFLAQLVHQRELAERALRLRLERDVDERAVDLAVGHRAVRRAGVAGESADGGEEVIDLRDAACRIFSASTSLPSVKRDGGFHRRLDADQKRALVLPRQEFLRQQIGDSERERRRSRWRRQ